MQFIYTDWHPSILSLHWQDFLAFLLWKEEEALEAPAFSVFSLDHMT